MVNTYLISTLFRTTWRGGETNITPRVIIRVGAYLKCASVLNSKWYTQGHREYNNYHVSEEKKAKAALSKMKGLGKEKYLQDLESKYELIAKVCASNGFSIACLLISRVAVTAFQDPWKMVRGCEKSTSSRHGKCEESENKNVRMLWGYFEGSRMTTYTNSILDKLRDLGWGEELDSLSPEGYTYLLELPAVCTSKPLTDRCKWQYHPLWRQRYWHQLPYRSVEF